MNFTQLDRRMRVFETAHDHCVLPGIHMVARIDGRSFSHLTRVAHKLDAPYDERFRDCMVATMKHVMTCGFSVLYGYTQSDEINLLLRRDDTLFGRKLRKLNSVFAGEASAKFSLTFGHLGAFDCRISQLPTEQDVVDYFRWRSEDALRNALNGHAYWLMRRQGLTDRDATERLKKVSASEIQELLFQNGINFNELPAWHKRGIGALWSTVEQVGIDPRTGREVTSTKRQLRVQWELPMRSKYDEFIRRLVTNQSS